jgi:DNA-directed RNA polymerase subunit RPC12/RpoP
MYKFVCYNCKREWKQEKRTRKFCNRCGSESIVNLTAMLRPTKQAPDVVESAASVSISPTPEVSASEAESQPATTQVM